MRKLLGKRLLVRLDEDNNGVETTRSGLVVKLSKDFLTGTVVKVGVDAGHKPNEPHYICEQDKVLLNSGAKYSTRYSEDIIIFEDEIIGIL